MLLTPTELERLTIFTAAELARKRRARGCKLNHPEAVALMTDEILEGARDGRSVADLMSFGSTILSAEDVMPGVPALIPIFQVEGVFPDGTKLVTVHQPVRPVKDGAPDLLEPGALVVGEDEIEINAGRRRIEIEAVRRATARSKLVPIIISLKSIKRCGLSDPKPLACASIFPLAPRCGLSRARPR